MTDHLPGLTPTPHDGPPQQLALRCDAPACEAKMFVEYRGDSGLDIAQFLTRSRASEDGWTMRDGRDLCPVHSYATQTGTFG